VSVSLARIPQQYASQLATVQEEALKEASSHWQMALVGCGDWKLIENYKSTFSLFNQSFQYSLALFHENRGL